MRVNKAHFVGTGGSGLVGGGPGQGGKLATGIVVGGADKGCR